MISIHSTTRVETRCRSHLLPPLLNFNPLHHEGGDVTQFLHSLLYEISIHSTTRVETRLHRKRLGGRKFQSTPPRGWRPVGFVPTETDRAFQSTPPRGWRRQCEIKRDDDAYFNPRYVRTPADFNPLHHEGGDAASSHRTLFYAYFNPLHHEGGDATAGIAWLTTLKFQSTPPRGWRQQYYTITTTILQHISTNKSYPTPSNHGQPSLHTRKSVLIVQIFRCESPRKSMFASGSHQNTLYRFTARGQVRISAVLPH